MIVSLGQRRFSVVHRQVAQEVENTFRGAIQTASPDNDVVELSWEDIDPVQNCNLQGNGDCYLNFQFHVDQ
jgi:hypothetical protein